jgi:AraC family transcriptional regulator of adaptative response/methylated-DNA-[protein]-cysteine methyltransferase
MTESEKSLVNTLITVETSTPHAAMIDRVCRYIQENPDKPTLAEISAKVGMSPSHLQRVFKREMGISPREYAESLRMKRFKSALRHARENDDPVTVTSAMYDAGFGSSSRLYERSAEHLGMTPSAYRKGGAGMVIGYVISDSPMGRILVAMTEHGVCAVCIGANDEELEHNLRKEYPRATIRRNIDIICEWVDQIMAYLNGWRPSLNLPTDVRATAFQRRVWNALLEIPPGETWTYTQVAEHIGAPKAVRAVASACAANPTALVIPCHRVVGADGKMRGYRWGISLKEALLQQEHDIALKGVDSHPESTNQNKNS